MKRQNSQLSSTSRRDPPPESLRAKSIGCMSGIIHLLSKYQNRHKKSLTFGKSKQEKDIIVFSSSSPNSDQTLVSAACVSPATPPPQRQRRSRNENNREGKGAEVVDFSRRRISCDLPTRSPTLSAEIRRSSSVNSPTMIGKSPALVARLMGLEPVPAEETSSEKRRKLLGALEKCDNDLKALKEIIMAFRSPESHPPSATIAGNCLNRDEEVRTISGRKFRDCNCGVDEKQQQQQPPQPCSRLHLNRINRTTKGRENGGQEIEEEPKKKNPGAIEEDRISISSLNPCITKLQERIIRLQQISSIQLETKASSRIMENMNLKKTKKKQENDDGQPLTWRSKTMGESLEEISKEISWGLKHEMVKIACRRRLRF
ncbi:uncharacterized protein LOC120072954 isoform X2 [Benincasa hispida]|uniref:uncharacterized protein LOC120072954 isoform X2 n=1 Tax=Benincasa hispida TaxID=102211 RepID=UPI0019006A4E|nr:uncharacterized protein LOC120072954 isoform X2 [Benincasa hispida]